MQEKRQMAEEKFRRIHFEHRRVMEKKLEFTGFSQPAPRSDVFVRPRGLFSKGNGGCTPYFYRGHRHTPQKAGESRAGGASG